MNLFYLLLVLMALALGNLLLGLILASSAGRAPKMPTERRRPLLNAFEAHSLGLLEQVVGEGRRVQALMPLHRLIAPAHTVSQRRARRWRAQLGDLSVDLAVLSADGTQPLCAVLLTAAGKRPRRVRRDQARVRALCEQADLPVLTLSGEESSALEAFRTRLEELIWPLEESLVTEQPVASEDEDALLAGLAAAMRDRSVAHQPRGR